MLKKLFLLLSLVLCSQLMEATQGAKEVWININHADFYCQTMGQGKPLIVLHGGPGLSQEYLLPQMSALAKNHFVIFYDQRGSGSTKAELNPNSINLDTFIEDLEAIRNFFNLDKFILLGHSWGGFLAMQYALAHPASVEKLILMNSMPASSDECLLFFQELARRTAPYHDELETMKATQAFASGDPEMIEKYYRLIFQTYCYQPEKAHALSLRLSQQAAINSIRIPKFFKEHVFVKTFNLHDHLKSLSIDTLVIHGDHDPIPPCCAENLHKSLPQSQLVIMEKTGHFPYVEEPEFFFKSIDQFLDN